MLKMRNGKPVIFWRRKELDLSRSDVARECSVSTSLVRGWETGTKRVMPHHQQPLAEALKTTIHKLFK